MALCAWTIGSQAQVVAPISAEGSGVSSLGPFGPSAFGGLTEQVLFESSVLGLTAGDVITGIAFRADSSLGAGGAPPSDLTFATFQITVGQAAVTAETMTGTFANNFASSTVVRPATSLTLTAHSFPTGSSPNTFGPVISFTTPFTYTGGDLVFEFRNPGSSSSLAVDASAGAGEGYGTTHRTFAALSPGASSGNDSSQSPIIQIQFTPVPEPATWTLLSGLTLCAFGIVRKMRS